MIDKSRHIQEPAKTILLFGKSGQIGWELQRTLSCLGHVKAFGHEDVDLNQINQIRDTVRRVKPDIIVNAAGYTAVDRAESEPEQAMLINGTVPGVLAEEAKRLSAGFVHYSTDYVFDGKKKIPYTEDDKPNPVNVYGKTKLTGEEAIQSVGGKYIIFRTSWVYGLRGYNFLLTMLKLARERELIEVVNDQIGAPTWCRMIAENTAFVLHQIFSPFSRNKYLFEELRGIYHLTAGGQTSWYGFASKILEKQLSGKDSTLKLIGIKTIDYKTKAKRPYNSLLDNQKSQNIFGNNRNLWSVDYCLAVYSNRQLGKS